MKFKRLSKSVEAEHVDAHDRKFRFMKEFVPKRPEVREVKSREREGLVRVAEPAAGTPLGQGAGLAPVAFFRASSCVPQLAETS